MDGTIISLIRKWTNEEMLHEEWHGWYPPEKDRLHSMTPKQSPQRTSSGAQARQEAAAAAVTAASFKVGSSSCQTVSVD